MRNRPEDTFEEQVVHVDAHVGVIERDLGRAAERLGSPEAGAPTGAPADKPQSHDGGVAASVGGWIIMEGMQAESQSVVHSDPEISGGTPVFRGTRVPVQSLFDYLEGGETLDHFLDQFPSVSKEQALAALDLARDFILARARSA